MSITDLYEGSKSRKSSGFSEGEKSRNCSGLGDGGKSRNCSGNSISQGLVSSGFLSSNPVNIPGTDSYGYVLYIIRVNRFYVPPKVKLR